MSVKRVLFIDDGDLTAIVDRLRRILLNDGIVLEYTKLDLNQDKFKKEEQNKFILDFEAIKREIFEHYIGEPFNLVACDYHFANDPMDGYKILKWLKNESSSNKHRIRRARFCLYSSEGDKFAQKTNSVEEIGLLIRTKFDDFLKRENLPQELARILKLDDSTFQFSKVLIEELEKYPNLEFRSVYPKFIGKSLSEIAHEIDRDSHHGIGFQRNLLELTIAHLIELNS